MFNILLSGVGGQGTVLSSKILAKCAINRGEPAHSAETIGMSQRGGCVVSHVRIGEGAHSPLIARGTADVIIGFEAAEAVRVLPYLKPNGTVIVNASAIKPVTDSLSDSGYEAEPMLDYLRSLPIKLIVVNGEEITAQCGSTKVLNIALLGAAAASGEIGTTVEELERVIESDVKRSFLEMNKKALALGAAQNR